MLFTSVLYIDTLDSALFQGRTVLLTRIEYAII